MPKVSVIIASYNHGPFLRENLDSILAQTYTDFEIVVVDDGSTDDSLVILHEYERQYPDKVRVFTHPGQANRGIYVTYNRGIAEARGSLIALQGSDDVWLPKKLAKQVPILDADSGIGAVYTRCFLIDEMGKVLGITGGPGRQELLPALLLRNVVSSQSLVYRRALFPTDQHFVEQTLIDDWEMHVQLAARTRLALVAEPLVKYRKHNRNTTNFDVLLAADAPLDRGPLLRILSNDDLKKRPDYPYLRRLAYRGFARGPLLLAIHAYNRNTPRPVFTNLWRAVQLYPPLLVEEPSALALLGKTLIGRDRVRKVSRVVRRLRIPGRWLSAGTHEK